MGPQASAQLGRSLTGLGSTHKPLALLRQRERRLSASIEQRPARLDLDLRQTGYGQLDRYLASGSIRYYDHHKDDRTLTFVSLAGDIVKDPNLANQLVLGGDHRPARVSAELPDRRPPRGVHVEQRVYTDWYPFRLIRVGGAVFFDSGAPGTAPAKVPRAPRWLSNVGFGLRFLSARFFLRERSARRSCLPPEPRIRNIKSFQFLVQTKLSL